MALDSRIVQDLTLRSSETRLAERIANKSVAVEPVRPPGSLVYNIDDALVYFSNGASWLPFPAVFRTGSIGAATTLTAADNGSWYAVTRTGVGYNITLPDPPIPGTTFKFVVVAVTGAQHVAILAAGPFLTGTIVDPNGVIQVSATNVIVFLEPVLRGATIEVYGVDATHYYVKAASGTASGIGTALP